MIDQPQNADDFSSNSERKPYSKMKVSRLGSLTNLTQAMQAGNYQDGALRSMFMAMAMG